MKAKCELKKKQTKPARIDGQGPLTQVMKGNELLERKLKRQKITATGDNIIQKQGKQKNVKVEVKMQIKHWI